MALKDLLKGRGGGGSPPYEDLAQGMLIREPRQRYTLICPECGDVTTVDAEKYCAGTIFAGTAPPACTQCGAIYEVH